MGAPQSGLRQPRLRQSRCPPTRDASLCAAAFCAFHHHIHFSNDWDSKFTFTTMNVRSSLSSQNSSSFGFSVSVTPSVHGRAVILPQRRCGEAVRGGFICRGDRQRRTRHYLSCQILLVTYLFPHRSSS